MSEYKPRVVWITFSFGHSNLQSGEEAEAGQDYISRDRLQSVPPYCTVDQFWFKSPSLSFPISISYKRENRKKYDLRAFFLYFSFYSCSQKQLEAGGDFSQEKMDHSPIQNLLRPKQ